MRAGSGDAGEIDSLAAREFVGDRAKSLGRILAGRAVDMLALEIPLEKLQRDAETRRSEPRTPRPCPHTRLPPNRIHRLRLNLSRIEMATGRMRLKDRRAGRRRAGTFAGRAADR